MTSKDQQKEEVVERLKTRIAALEYMNAQLAVSKGECSANLAASRDECERLKKELENRSSQFSQIIANFEAQVVDPDRERYRDRLDRMVAAMVAHDPIAGKWDYKMLLKECKRMLSAIDAEVDRKP